MINTGNRPSSFNLDSFSKRQREILTMVDRKGFATIDSLASHFNVTPQTIRRDINHMCDHKLLQRHQGGASRSSSAQNVDYTTRKSIMSEEKKRIAEMVAEKIPDNASLFINLGTTTEEVAMALAKHKNLRVITNNLIVAISLSDNKECQVIVAGGMVRKRDKGITGEATMEFMRQFKVDIGIIGASGIDEDGTLFDYDYHEVQVTREIIKNSRHVFLVTDHTKFIRNAMVKIDDLSKIDAIFTDRTPPLEFLELLKTKDVSLYVSENEEKNPQ
jgi:DeoR family glycerol-3-phosphate regulon repressor